MKRFKENMKTAVLTSKYIVNDKSPVLYIAHHEDGMWEFWGREKVDESEIMVITLEQIIALDPSVQLVSDLAMGLAAFRENKNQPWQIHSKN